ncbi:MULTISPECIES: hypothetical protein [Acinetobacter]
MRMLPDKFTYFTQIFWLILIA